MLPFKVKHKFSFFLCLIAFVHPTEGQDGSEDGILRTYFPDNPARDHAVICARYAEAAHRYAYTLIRTPYLKEPRETEFRNSDTARAFLLHARRRLDSIARYAPNDSKRLEHLLERTRISLERADTYLRSYRGVSDKADRKWTIEEALKRTASASIDAYHVSLLLAGEEGDASGKKAKEFHARMDSLEKKRRGRADPSKDAERLEMDRKNLKRLRDDYQGRLQGMREKLNELDRQEVDQAKLDSMQEEKRILNLKLEDTEAQMETIDRILQEKLFEKIGLDTSEVSEDAEFQVNRHGYYDDKELPIDEPQPEGLIFRVQIGYYTKGNRPVDKLKGLYPLWGERVSDKYIRYCVGKFREYSEADKAKRYLRDEGVEDAFVVAYDDGKKIPVVEAIKRREERGEP